MALTTSERQKYWETAEVLRNQLDAAAYEHIVLGLVFSKYDHEAFEARRGLQTEWWRGVEPAAHVKQRIAILKADSTKSIPTIPERGVEVGGHRRRTSGCCVCCTTLEEGQANAKPSLKNPLFPPLTVRGC